LLDTRRRHNYIPPLEVAPLHLYRSGERALGGALAMVKSDLPSSSSGSLDFKQWGLLAVQDGGRRKPVTRLPEKR
jgi:hypothetical protein